MSIPIRKITATEAIVESLKERIQQGEFKPGEKLPSEQELLGEYAVSRLTLREALAQLSALGIISVHHGKGAFVETKVSIPALDNVLIPLFPRNDSNRLPDLVEARSMLESEIAAKVAASRTESDIARLGRLLEYDPEIADDTERFAERDYRFHLSLAEMAGNKFLLAIYQALYRNIKSFLVQYAQSIDDRKEAMERHRPILEAIIDQDVERARELSRKHAGVCASFIAEVTREP